MRTRSCDRALAGGCFSRYIPRLEFLCNLWVICVMLWSFGLVIGKAIIAWLAKYARAAGV